MTMRFFVTMLTLLTFSIIPLTSLRAQPPALKNVTRHLDLAYVEDGSEKQKLDLYLPQLQDAPENGLPMVVWIHGGGWAKGSKAGIGRQLWVLEEGYALVSVGYRLTDEASFPAQRDDCRAAIVWLKQHANKYQLDPERIVVWGASAGGHLSSLTGLSTNPDDPSDDIQGIINWFGPAELLTMQQQRTLPTRLNADAPDSFESRLVGGPLQERKEIATEASPITQVSNDDPPVLIMHGDQDALVPLAQSQQLQQKLKQAQVDVELVILKGAGHGGPAFTSPASIETMRNFLHKCFQ